MRKYLTTILLVLFAGATLSAQENYKGISKEDSAKNYRGGTPYKVKEFPHEFKSSTPKNIIFIIGDGMGTSQIFAGLTANGGHLFLDNFKHVGFSKTQSSSGYVTDSAAGATALASGVKTYNGAIGVDSDTVEVKSILEMAEENGLATGLVSSSSITHATPASFIAHQPSREMYEEIAGDFLKTDIDVFIGGGYKHFTKRKDGRNLEKELKIKGYRVERDIDEIANVKQGRLAGLTAEEHNGRVSERKDMLPVATETAINILDNNTKGFFMMVEGSQVDWGGHQNNTNYIIEEMLDLDRSIGKALEFAAINKETLIVLTADHETGGFAVLDGNIKTGLVKGGFITGGHSGVMVPVFAYGPGAEHFTGIMENTEIPRKMMKLLGFMKNNE